MNTSIFRKFWTLDEERLEPGEREFCKAWLDKRDRYMAFISSILGLGFHSVTIFADKFLIDKDDVRQFFFLIHLLVFCLLFGYWVTRERFFGLAKFMTWVGQFITVLGYAYILFWISGIDLQVMVAHVKAWTAFIVLGIFIILLCPYHTYVSIIYSFVLITASWFSWSRLSGYQQMFGMSVLSFIGAQVFQRSSVLRSFEEARREYENRQKVVAAQKDSYERELMVARGIQDSLTPRSSFSANGIEGRFFMLRSKTVGGDWTAFRSLEGGEMIVVIADASGKGVQAALVTHAIQALWADALASPVFDPADWLQKVNRTLCRMGERSTHSATIGILKLGNGAIQYWSAGHLPVFLVSETLEQGVSSLGARGSLLGLGDSVDFVSVAQKIPADDFDVLLGTDGVFEKASSQSPRALRKLLDGLKSSPNYLNQQIFEIDDDRTLIWLRVSSGLARANG